jgi:DNA polymerase-3 subunit delta'
MALMTTTALLPWQQASWDQLQAMAAKMPHAVLFHGAQGVGKVAFVTAFARSLLCESKNSDGHACGTCVSCGWFDHYNHPDYRRVRPEILEDGDTADEGSEDDSGAKSTAKKAPSKDIKIDQIRALSGFMNVSTHRSGKRVVLLYPAENLTTEAANALLKTLEEPPPETIFLLVTHRVDDLLPTILSRCRLFALPLPAKHAALDWLQQQGVGDADIWLAEQGGAPLAAFEAAQGDSREAADTLLQHLMRPDVDGALKTADKLQKVAMADLVGWYQRWLYDLFSYKLSTTVRYYPRYQKEIAALSARLDVHVIARALKVTNDRRAVADHPLSAKLAIESMLLEYSLMFAG